jgi:predicted RNase H-like nuclease (RuvC/YqgF family)
MDSSTFIDTINRLNRENEILLRGIEEINNEKQKVINNKLHGFNDLFRSKDSENTKTNILKDLDAKIGEKNNEIEDNKKQIQEIENHPDYEKARARYEKERERLYFRYR